ncbi:MAG: tetratricopeptide repeat protein [Bacteroidales bacterium]
MDAGGRHAATVGPHASAKRWTDARTTLVFAIVLAIAGTWAYGNSFQGVFVLDDVRAIVDNTTITSLATALEPPGACTVAGRPVANLSLAFNYAIAPPSVRDVFRVGRGPRAGMPDDFLRNIWGYHLVNLAVHLVAGLLLFGCVRRTLSTPRLAPVFGEAATWLASAIALVWLVHPLQTESVTYVVQRVESLMGLWYLLTLYCAIRAWEGRTRGAWEAAAIAACALGMATKEVMVTAPLIVGLWDRTFAPPGHRVRWRLLAGLAATWLVLALLVWNEHRAPSLDVGPGTTARYLFTQAPILLHYLRLSVVPAPLVLLYTWPIVPSFGAVVIPVIVVACLVALTVFGVVRRSPLGFAGAWFFLILAPTSSVLPIVTEVAAEHRMYLPLAAVVSCGVVALFLAGRRLLRTWQRPAHARAIAAIALLAVVVTLGVQTRRRNEDYRTETGVWADAVAKQPDNQRARVLYGVALMNEGRAQDAEAQLREAVVLQPDDPVAIARLAGTLAAQGKLDEAIAAWEKSTALMPNDYGSQRHLGEAYLRRQQERQAIERLDRALALAPDARDPSLLLELATLLADARDTTLRNPGRAIELAGRAVVMTGRQDPRALDVLSVAQAGVGRFPEAAATAEEGLTVARQQGNRSLIAELEYRSAAYRARAGS